MYQRLAGFRVGQLRETSEPRDSGCYIDPFSDDEWEPIAMEKRHRFSLDVEVSTLLEDHTPEGSRMQKSKACAFRNKTTGKSGIRAHVRVQPDETRRRFLRMMVEYVYDYALVDLRLTYSAHFEDEEWAFRFHRSLSELPLGPVYRQENSDIEEFMGNVWGDWDVESASEGEISSADSDGEGE